MKCLHGWVVLMALTLLVNNNWLYAKGSMSQREKVSFYSRGEKPVRLVGEMQWREGELPRRLPGVVICHPDPRYGGTMDNHVVRAVADYLEKNDMVVLRFNFRGVGGSDGSFDDGAKAIEDCLGAIVWLRSQGVVDPQLTGVVGYSFGAIVGLQAASLDIGGTRCCVSIGFPLHPDEKSLSPYSFLRAVRASVLFISGTEDSLSSLEVIQRLAALTGVKAFFMRLTNADHSFLDQTCLDELCTQTSHFLLKHLSTLSETN